MLYARQSVFKRKRPVSDEDIPLLLHLEVVECGVVRSELPKFPDGSPMLPGARWFAMRGSAEAQLQAALSPRRRPLLLTVIGGEVLE